MERLDKFLFLNNYFDSREKAKTAILKGSVLVDGKKRPPAFILNGDEKIEILMKNDYVSRGAYKLKHAVEKFNVNLLNKTVLDIGASTGGFTQVALECGAKKVYAVDVGENQLSEILKKNKNVVDMSGCDFRSLKKIDDVDFIVSDLSFISLRHIVPVLVEKYNGVPLILLFKPQFECGKDVAKTTRGVIKNKNIHKKLLEDFVCYLRGFNVAICGVTNSPIKGKSGNIEYLFYLNGTGKFDFNLNDVVGYAFKEL